MRFAAIRWKDLLPYMVLCAVFITTWAARGVLADKEALKYTGCAADLLHGNTTDLFGNYKGFASYVLFLVPFMAVGAPQLAVGAQMILALFALRALGALARRISGSARAEFVAMLMGAVCIPWQQWTIALYSESFFTNMLLLFLERITRTTRPDGGLIALALVLLCARPVGLLFVGPALLWKLNAGRTVPLPSWSMFLGHAAVLVLAIALPGIPRDQMTPIVEGHVICGFPERPGAMEGFTGSSILRAQTHLFATEPVGYAVGLFFRRVLSLFTLPRPYYSSGHNVFLALHYAFFVLAFIGVRRFFADRIVRLVLATALCYTMLIGLAHDEWSGRFLVPLWPLLTLFAGISFAERSAPQRA